MTFLLDGVCRWPLLLLMLGFIICFSRRKQAALRKERVRDGQTKGGA